MYTHATAHVPVCVFFVPMCTPGSLARCVATVRRTPSCKCGANFTYCMRQASCSVSNPTCPSQLLIRLSTFPPTSIRLHSFFGSFTLGLCVSIMPKPGVEKNLSFSTLRRCVQIHVSLCLIGLPHRQIGPAALTLRTPRLDRLFGNG